MPRQKRSCASKRKTSKCLDASQQSLEESSASELLAQFEEEFARKLKKYDELLEIKLDALNRHKEWLKLKYLSSSENVPPVKDPSGPVNGKEIRSAREVRKQSSQVRTRSLSSSKGINPCETMMRNLPRKTKTVMTPTNVIQQTPMGQAINLQSSVMTPLVTPKITPGTPVSVMRLPRQGELAISVSGSPLLVAATIQEKRSNINVPVGQGRVISINGEANLNNPYDIPELDDETKRQLQTLQENLEALLNMKTKR